MITIKVCDLKKVVDELIADKIEIVEISMLDREEEDGEISPATLHISGYEDEFSCVDYDPIEEVIIDK